MKTSLVTGASTGIGLEIARGLAKAGHRVLMLSRDKGRAAAAVERVKAAAADPKNVVSLTADLGSLADVRRAAAEVKQVTDRLDVLINNAAVVPYQRTVTADGFESAFATNVLGPIVLVHELEGLLAAAAPSRVINFFGGNERTFDLGDLQSEKGTFDGFKAYGRTKLYTALLTLEMSRRLKPKGITVNLAYPGLVNTEGIRALKGSVRIFVTLMRPFMKTAEQGAATALWLATDPQFDTVTAKAYGSFKRGGKDELSVPAPAWDPTTAKQLYETCERLAKVT